MRPADSSGVSNRQIQASDNNHRDLCHTLERIPTSQPHFKAGHYVGLLNSMIQSRKKFLAFYLNLGVGLCALDSSHRNMETRRLIYEHHAEWCGGGSFLHVSVN
jgi:hypothetical protein